MPMDNIQGLLVILNLDMSYLSSQILKVGRGECLFNMEGRVGSTVV